MGVDGEEWRWVETTDGKRPLGRPRHRLKWIYNVLDWGMECADLG
jgi:hypothetical protein